MRILLKKFVALGALASVFVVWLAETLLSPHGLYRLGITLLAQPIRPLRVYAFDLWLASDQHINALFGGNVDTTISGRIGYHAARGRPGYQLAEKVVDGIFYLAIRQVGHCRASIEPGEIH